MAYSFQTLAHALKREAGGDIHSLGHCHQLLAAGLGYESYAAYKASTQEPADFGVVRHILLDTSLIEARATELDPNADEHFGFRVTYTMLNALNRLLPECSAFRSEAELVEHLADEFEQFLSEQATYRYALARGPEDWDEHRTFDLYADGPFEQMTGPNSGWVAHLSSLVLYTGEGTLDDEDRAVGEHAPVGQDAGDDGDGEHVSAYATGRFDRIGRCLLGEARFEFLQADYYRAP